MDSILEDLYAGRVTPAQAKRLLKDGFLDVDGIARIDFLRPERCAVPEIVIAEGKDYKHLRSISEKTLKQFGRVIISRIAEPQAKALVKDLRSAIKGFSDQYSASPHTDARGLVLREKGRKVQRTGGVVGIITAGTSDIPVALEAKMVLEEHGVKVLTAFDVGVAGLHRLAPVIKKWQNEDIDVFIAAAGREGTLPALVAGLVDSPVIGLPVSTGYGYGGKGEAALKSMLQSCAPLMVVNIDAGIVAGACALQISNKMHKKRDFQRKALR